MPLNLDSAIDFIPRLQGDSLVFTVWKDNSLGAGTQLTIKVNGEPDVAMHVKIYQKNGNLAAMLFIGGIATYTFVWDLGDLGVGLMTVFNMIAILPLSGQAILALKEYEARRKADPSSVV